MADDHLTPQQLARQAVEAYVRRSEVIAVPADLGEEFNGRAGAFVCLKRQGELRGCIGTILPRTDSLAAEIIGNAIQAAAADPRFMPVTQEELDELTYTVDVLSEPQGVAGPADLDPRIYGCIVRGSGGRVGLLLPDLEGVDTAKMQVSICRQKGGIGPDEPVDLERFTVTRYGGD